MADIAKITAEVNAIKDVAAAKKYAADNGLTITVKDDADLDTIKAAIIAAATPEKETSDDDEKKYDTLSPSQIVDKLSDDDEREISKFTRVIKNVDRIDNKVGSFGSYNRIKLSLTKGIDGMQQEGDEWIEGVTTTVFIFDSALMACIKNNAVMAPYWNALQKDINLLYTVLAGTKVKIVSERVEADEDYINPFKRAASEYSQDHIWYANNIYEIVEWGKPALEWINLHKLAQGGVFSNVDVLKGLLGLS